MNTFHHQARTFEQYAKGIELKGAERQVRLTKQYEEAKTPEAKAAIAQQIRDLSGKQAADWAVQVTPATKNADGSTTAGSMVRYNKATSEVPPVGDAQQKLPITENPEADAILQNKKMSKEETAAALKKLGY